jgi:Cytochrome P460
MLRFAGLVQLGCATAMLACGGQARDAQPGAGGSGNDTAAAFAGRSEAGHAGASSGTATGGAVAQTPTAGSPAIGTEGGTASANGAGGEDQAAGAPSGPAAVDLDAILKSYRTFAPQTPEPVSVSGYIFNLCRLPSLRENEFLASVHGDGRYLQDWANPAAEQGIRSRGAPAFPEGAVIVKEKYAGSGTDRAEPVALGIMIKQRPGFDTARGDWDYAYYEPALGMIRTAEQSTYCASCHAGAAATDYVFVDGLDGG